MVRVDLPARPETFYQTIEIVFALSSFSSSLPVLFSSGSELDRGTIGGASTRTWRHRKKAVSTRSEANGEINDHPKTNAERRDRRKADAWRGTNAIITVSDVIFDKIEAGVNAYVPDCASVQNNGKVVAKKEQGVSCYEGGTALPISDLIVIVREELQA